MENKMYTKMISLTSIIDEIKKNVLAEYKEKMEKEATQLAKEAVETFVSRAASVAWKLVKQSNGESIEVRFSYNEVDGEK